MTTLCEAWGDAVTRSEESAEQREPPMHALGTFISDLMASRSMSRPDLEQASGLSRQHIHQLLNDRRTGLGRMVDDQTLAGLVRAFPDVGESAFIVKAAESLGVPVDRLNTASTAPPQLSDDALLGILAQRLRRAGRAPLRAAKAESAEGSAVAARRGARERDRLDRDWDGSSQ